MPDTRILRRPEVERQTQLSKASIYRQMHAGNIPEAGAAWRARRRLAGGRNRRLACQPRAGELRSRAGRWVTATPH